MGGCSVLGTVTISLVCVVASELGGSRRDSTNTRAADKATTSTTRQ
jgi:hypothetical protein